MHDDRLIPEYCVFYVTVHGIVFKISLFIVYNTSHNCLLTLCSMTVQNSLITSTSCLNNTPKESIKH